MALIPVITPRTVRAVILPGWMQREQAIKTLTEECVDPCFDTVQAEALWNDYRNRVENSLVRDVAGPRRLILNAVERAQANVFLRNARQTGATNIQDVIKFDPRRCVIWQFVIITDRSQSYAQNMTTPATRISHALGSHAVPAGNVQIHAAPNDIRLKIPHAEFMFNFLTTGSQQGFQIQEMAKNIAVTSYDGRLLLFAGYHRAFAAMTNEYPEGIDRSLIAVLTTDGEAVLSPQSPNQGVRDMLRGLRPALLEDFLDDRLAMKVSLRKRRCELWIQGQIKWFDDES